jgi:hypothetical protein
MKKPTVLGDKGAQGWLTVLFTFALLLPGYALADNTAISVKNGWLRATPPGAVNAAAFLTLQNSSSHEILLTGVQCPAAIAARCEIHEHIMREGRMRMQAVSTSLHIPAHGELGMAPGGYHVMLFDLVHPLHAGEQVELVFTFADQSIYHLKLRVKSVSEE